MTLPTIRVMTQKEQKAEAYKLYREAEVTARKLYEAKTKEIDEQGAPIIEIDGKRYIQID